MTTIPAALLTRSVLSQVSRILSARTFVHASYEDMTEGTMVLMDFLSENLGDNAKLLPDTITHSGWEPDPLMLQYIEQLRKGIPVLDGRALRIMLKQGLLTADFDTGDFAVTDRGVTTMRIILARSSWLYHRWVVADMAACVVRREFQPSVEILNEWVYSPNDTLKFQHLNTLLRGGVQNLNHISDFISGRWLISRAPHWIGDHGVAAGEVEQAKLRWKLLQLLAPFLPDPVQNNKG